jgi:hypothetical protein
MFLYIWSDCNDLGMTCSNLAPDIKNFCVIFSEFKIFIQLNHILSEECLHLQTGVVPVRTLDKITRMNLKLLRHVHAPFHGQNEAGIGS